ncbi:hypothetical protein [Streptobacillus moniliformis]|uniref:hypothetical protein n=1 Tax=Streptobacillus moniliformis TaxID=34105 RepID=UPI0007E446F5|nr:hypothetical protein [Streptobacillus moniliformis]
MKEINKQEGLKYFDNMIDRILYSLKEVSKPLIPFIEYGYIEDYELDNVFLTYDDGMFILSLKQSKTIDISINLRKEKKREFNLIFLYPNDIENKVYNKIIWLEETLDKLIKSEHIREKCRAIDYNYEIELVKISEVDLTGTLKFDIKINLIEF